MQRGFFQGSTLVQLPVANMKTSTALYKRCCYALYLNDDWFLNNVAMPTDVITQCIFYHCKHT